MWNRRIIPAIAILAAITMVAAFPAWAHQEPWYGSMADPAEDSSLRVREVAALDDPSGPEWGTDKWIVYAVGPCDAFHRGGPAPDAPGCRYIRASADGLTSVGFPLHLPAGALIQHVRLVFWADSTSNQISAGFWKVDRFGENDLVAGLDPNPTAAGWTYQNFSGISETINNSMTDGHFYNILVVLPKSGADWPRLARVIVYYKLQVSPAPATATFNDVPVGHWAFQHVEALVASGITAGTGGGNFSPDASLTRAQMAVFLAKAFGLHYQY